MKRKFKLFATVASLCLCLALMAFGVYAATSVTYTASGSVTYTVTDIVADFTVTTYGSGTKGIGREAVPTEGSGEGQVNFAKIKDYDVVRSYTGTKPVEPGQASADLGTTEIAPMDFAENDAYKIEIKVDNKAKSGNINVKAAITDIGNANATVLAKLGTYATDGVQIANQASATLVFYVLLKDPTLSIDADKTFSIKLTTSNVA